MHPLISSFSFLTTTISFLTGSKRDIPTDDGILILDHSNFDTAISRYDRLMVNFYLPWCKYCQAFTPEYLKVKKMLNDQQSGIALAQVDAEQEKALVSEQDITDGFPTLKFFKNGRPVVYKGSRKADKIVSWLNNKSK